LANAVKRPLRNARAFQVRRHRLRWFSIVLLTSSSVVAVALLVLSFLARLGIPPWWRTIAIALSTTLEGLGSGLLVGCLAVFAAGTFLGTAALLRARSTTSRLLGEIDEANLEHARQMLALHGRLDIGDLEQALGVSPEQAQAVLVKLAAHDGTRLAAPKGLELAVELNPSLDAPIERRRL
jgi:hypothetical protein